MKQFAKPFLSIILLLSVAGICADTGSDEDGSTIGPSGFSGEGSGTGSGTGDFGGRDRGQKTGSGNQGERRGSGQDCGESGHQKCSSTLYLPRPQGLNYARFFNPFWYGPDSGDQCGYLDIGYRYRQSFKDRRIAECLFGSEDIIFSGSKANHVAGEFLADNIGLSPNFRGKLHIEPRIRDHMFDIDSRWELGSWLECLEGAYFKLRGTVVHTRWELRECETIETASTSEFSTFPPGYMALSPVPTPATNSIKTALGGDFLFGDMQEKWRFGRLAGRDNDTKLANIDLILGYDFLLCDEYHLGAFIIGVAPTGTTPKSYKVFEAIAGNGHHWELGGGLTAHYEFWNCDDQSLGLYLDGHATHLFKDTQWRLFDLKSTREGDGCLSRYTLLKEFSRNGNYSGHLIPGANWLGRRVESSFSVQGDAALRLLYRSCGWALAAGYEVYGRTHEKLQNACESRCAETLRRHVGIKGITDVQDPAAPFDTHSTGSTSDDGMDFRILAATQSEFRPKSGLNVGVDNPFELSDPQFITAESAITGKFVTAVDSAKDDGRKPAPVLLKCERDINFGSRENRAAKGNSDRKAKKGNNQRNGSDQNNEDREERRGIRSQITHKFFATIDYQFEDCEEYRPYIGVGGEVEFAQKGECHVCTPNLWGAWVRTGVNF